MKERLNEDICKRVAKLFNKGKLKKGAMLGGEYRLFFASREGDEGVRRCRTADDIRDYHGLIQYDSENWLFSLSSRMTLEELKSEYGVRIAAPSFFEGIDNLRFQEKPRSRPDDRWNRVFNLPSLTDDTQTGDGAPEIVISPIPMTVGFTCSALGCVRTHPRNVCPIPAVLQQDFGEAMKRL